MWPFNKPVEARASYTDSITNAILAQASSAAATAEGTAAIESASGLLSRGFASAEVSGADGLPITPGFLARVGRDLIWPGESVFLIDVDGGAVRLHPVANYEIAGSYDPSTWVYSVELAGPSRSARLVRPASAILHFRYSARYTSAWTRDRSARTCADIGEVARRNRIRTSGRGFGDARRSYAYPIGWPRRHAYETAIHCLAAAR